MIKEITALICSGEKLYLSQIYTPSRETIYVQARQMIMYFAKKETKLTLNEIGEPFGFDHGNVKHAIKTVGNLIETDKRFRDKMLDYESQIQQMKNNREITTARILAGKLKEELEGINARSQELQQMIDRQSELVSKIVPKIEVTDCDTKFEKPFANHPVRSTAFDGYIQHNL